MKIVGCKIKGMKLTFFIHNQFRGRIDDITHSDNNRSGMIKYHTTNIGITRYHGITRPHTTSQRQQISGITQQRSGIR